MAIIIVYLAILAAGLLISLIYMLKALAAGWNIGRYERNLKLQSQQPVTLLLQLSMFEPAITLLLGLLGGGIERTLTVFLPELRIPHLIDQPLLPAISMVGLLIVLPACWIGATDLATRRICWRLIWMGAGRIVCIFLAIFTAGLGLVFGIGMLAWAIRSARSMALQQGISISRTLSVQASLYAQPITMGAEGLSVSDSGPMPAAAVYVPSLTPEEPQDSDNP